MTTIVGIDEAGRGPLAGPVCVGSVMIRKPSLVKRAFPIVRDSKKLSPKRREEWFQKIKELNRRQGISVFIPHQGIVKIKQKNLFHLALFFVKKLGCVILAYLKAKGNFDMMLKL